MSCELQNLGHSPARVSLEAAIGGKFHYWYGASGRAYLHTVFTSENCPELPGASYIAVRRRSGGGFQVIGIGMLNDREFGTADQVHIHLLGETPAGVRRIIEDLRTRHQVIDMC